jgi:hypothetical protein
MFSGRAGGRAAEVRRLILAVLVLLAGVGFAGCNAHADARAATLTTPDPPDMAYPAEHYATLTDADSHVDLNREMEEFGQGIDVIYGVNETEGPKGGKTEVHKVVFDDRLWTVDGAKEWLEENDFSGYEEFTEAPRENPAGRADDNRNQTSLNVLRQHRRAFEDGTGSVQCRAAGALAESVEQYPGVEARSFGDDTEAITLAMATSTDAKDKLEEAVQRGDVGRIVEKTRDPGLYHGTRYTVEQRVAGETVPVRLLVTTTRQALIHLAAWQPYHQGKADVDEIGHLQAEARKADRGDESTADEVLTDEKALRETVALEEPSRLSRAARSLMQSDAVGRVAGYAAGVTTAGVIAVLARTVSKANARS